MPLGGTTKTHNRLWLARKRRGLRQKQVAFLLNHHTVDQISRYEKGLRVPTLETALRLEIVYQTPLRLLFADLYEKLQGEIKQKMQGSAGLQSTAGEQEDLREFCAYAELLSMPSLSQAERDKVRRHVIDLTRRMAYL